MTEKKSLNLDFLDEDPKDVVEKIHAPPTISQDAKGNNTNILQYFKSCYSNFSKFSKEYLLNKNPRYLLAVVWAVGMGNVADRLTSSNSTSWGEVWAGVLIGGVISGAITYYLAGWFYYTRVTWSKGQGNIESARNIYVFSSLPISIVSIGSLLFNQIAYGSDYFDVYYSDASSVDVIFAFLSIAAIIYSIYLSYRAVREVFKADKGRAIGWFIIAPTLFYTAVIAIAIV